MELKAYLTAAGSAVVAKLLASQGALEFTRAELGSGSVSSEAAARARTSLVDKAADADLVSARLSNGQAAVDVQFSNAALTADLSVSELAIYCKDPSDSASEVLYCYASFGDTPDAILRASAALYARVYRVYTFVSDLAQLSVAVSPAAFVTQEQLSGALSALKIPKITSVSAALPVAGWSGKTQTVSVAGVTANAIVQATYAPACRAAWIDADVYCSAQGAGTLTFTCDTVPTAALTASVVIIA